MSEMRNMMLKTNDPMLVKVSRNSKPAKVAGAIAKIVRSGVIVEVRSIGSGATHQAVKALALATDFLVEDSLELKVSVNFCTITEEGSNDVLSGISFMTYTEVNVQFENPWPV